MLLGDKLTDEECDQLFQGMEDAQGNINYEGTASMNTMMLSLSLIVFFCVSKSLTTIPDFCAKVNPSVLLLYLLEY